MKFTPLPPPSPPQPSSRSDHKMVFRHAKTEDLFDYPLVNSEAHHFTFCHQPLSLRLNGKSQTGSLFSFLLNVSSVRN